MVFWVSTLCGVGGFSNVSGKLTASIFRMAEFGSCRWWSIRSENATSKQSHYNKQYKNSEDYLLSKTGSVHLKMYNGTKFRCTKKESILRDFCCRQEKHWTKKRFL